MQNLERLSRARKIGFLFCGGASRCIFQVGAVETLYAFGIHPAVCLGVSGGAWNAAAVAVGNWRRLRAYWRFFCRMPALDVSNLLREHSPFRWRTLHERAFRRYIGHARLRAEHTLPLFVALTRRRDRASVIADVHHAADPLEVMLASNYLPPFYTHAPVIDGERYGDGGFADGLPYETLFAQGCDMVVVISQKGVCEGGLFRNLDDPDHVIADERVVVIRPRHPLELSFTERRWERLALIADLGAARARELLLGEEPAEQPECKHRKRPSWYVAQARRLSRAVLAALVPGKA